MEIKIKLKAEKLCEFSSFQQWVNKASRWLGGFSQREKIICIDKNGNACNSGREFIYARDNDLFPVIGYRLIKSGEDENHEDNFYSQASEETGGL